ncbi:hypothetical protein [Pseudonocardia sp. H11422]|uniref:hypothetical protein n=1 Tax=Pseudonocardia sp. H11422 TaxID=2835866 RepID=UPI001BDBCF05|nr:hypothetical protein [Pseudonocardia sp. H11422]
MRDPQADIGRRAWVACPRCADHAGCAPCHDGRSCETHWRFLLAAEARRIFVQCPGCWYRWWHDTEFGAGDRPADVDQVPAFPDHGGAAA